MAADLFPFGLTSHVALVTLIQKSYPNRTIDDRYVEFGDMYSDPTPEEPGRTFIEMTDKVTHEKDWYCYRRLDINLVRVLLGDTPLRVKTPITSRAIVNEINKSRGLALSEEDVVLSDVPLTTQAGAFQYTLQILPTSSMYYGKKVLNISAQEIDLQIMRMEDDTLMQEENGAFMLLEQVPAV